ncbi:glyoxylate reductase, partial [Phenoliferia sp. Uapishka_3]
MVKTPPPLQSLSSLFRLRKDIIAQVVAKSDRSTIESSARQLIAGVDALTSRIEDENDKEAEGAERSPEEAAVLVELGIRAAPDAGYFRWDGVEGWADTVLPFLRGWAYYELAGASKSEKEDEDARPAKKRRVESGEAKVEEEKSHDEGGKLDLLDLSLADFEKAQQIIDWKELDSQPDMYRLTLMSQVIRVQAQRSLALFLAGSKEESEKAALEAFEKGHYLFLNIDEVGGVGGEEADEVPEDLRKMMELGLDPIRTYSQAARSVVIALDTVKIKAVQELDQKDLGRNVLSGIKGWEEMLDEYEYEGEEGAKEGWKKELAGLKKEVETGAHAPAAALSATSAGALSGSRHGDPLRYAHSNHRNHPWMRFTPSHSLLRSIPASSRPSTQSIYARMSSSTSRPQILLMDPIKLATPLLDELAEKYTIVPLTSTTRDEFMADCSTKYSECQAMYRHFKGASTKVTGLFDAPLVSSLPKSLKFIAHNGAGYDQIDVAACTSSSIAVSNVPTAPDGATADTALFLLLGSLRQFGLAQANLRAGSFNAGLGLSNDPKGKLVGILGMGGIGRAFATRAKAVGMEVQYHNRTRLSPELEGGATYVSFEDLLTKSDVISLNLPLNANTKHIIGAAEFKKMKKSAVLINTARGGCVDEKALVEALDGGAVAGCGLDVYENEPSVEAGLLKSDKAFLLPHVGTLTVETQDEMERVCLRNIDTGLTTGKFSFVVAEQIGKF